MTGVTLGSAGTAAAAGVGGYAITASGATGNGLSNYTVSYVDGTLTVDPAALTITADGASKTYGDTAALTGYTTAGLKNSDSVTGVTLGSAGTAAAAGVGGYAITASGATGNGLSNYTVSYVDGTLIVNARPIVVTADPISRPVNTENPVLTYSVGGLGLVNGDTLTGSLASAPASAPAGLYAISQGTLVASRDYILTFHPATLTITPAEKPGEAPQAPNSETGGAAARAEELERVLTSAVLPRNLVAATASQAIPLSQPPGRQAPVPSTEAPAASGNADGTAGADTVRHVTGASSPQDASGAAAACTGGAATGSACTSIPHPENTRVGRFLTFSMR